VRSARSALTAELQVFVICIAHRLAGSGLRLRQGGRVRKRRKCGRLARQPRQPAVETAETRSQLFRNRCVRSSVEGVSKPERRGPRARTFDPHRRSHQRSARCKMVGNDVVNALWTIPKERMKTGREHCVPLSQAGIRIIGPMAAAKRSDHVFSSRKRRG
jgi:hypothetical protein